MQYRTIHVVRDANRDSVKAFADDIATAIRIHNEVQPLQIEVVGMMPVSDGNGRTSGAVILGREVPSDRSFG